MSLRTETIDGRFYQWDTNQILIVEDEPNCSEVHFGYKDGSKARVCSIYEVDGKRVVNVPNELLREDREIFAYPIIEEGDDTVTCRPKSFTVKSRAKPDDYVYTETEVQSYEALEERITALEENGGTGGAAVKTVNGVSPDGNGNVEIVIPDMEVEIPDVLPNPNALTLTGAVEATYDGSKAVSVEIPAGSGKAGTTVLQDTTLTEAVSQYRITQDKDGNALNVDLDANILGVEIHYPEAFTEARHSRLSEDTNFDSTHLLDNVSIAANAVWTHRFFTTRIGNSRIFGSCAERADGYVSPKNAPNFYSERQRQHNQYLTSITVGNCNTSWAGYTLPVGTRILVYTQGR